MNIELLRAERIRQGWSQTKLAEEMGVDTRTIRRWEQGRTIPFPYYRKQLCALFDKTAEELGLPCDIDENKAVEYAALAVQQPIETLETEQLETPEPSFSQMVADSAPTRGDALITQQQPVSSLSRHLQAHQEAMHIFGDHLFGFRSLWNVHVSIKNRGPFRPANRFPWYLLLIISTILLVVLAITVVLPIPTPTPIPIPRISYEAESSQNTWTGTAGPVSCSGCSGGYRVCCLSTQSYEQNGTLQLNNVNKSIAGGSYTMTIYYTEGDPVSRTGYVSVNGGPAIAFTGICTGSWDTVEAVNMTISLSAGNNTIKFFNPKGPGPDIDRIVV